MAKMNFVDKRILVTGGGRGIGLELARELVKRGAHVAISGRNISSLKTACAEIGDKCLPIEADMAAPDTPEQLARFLKENFGGLDVLINNAAIQYNYSFFERDYQKLAEDIEQELTVNLFAVIRLSAVCIPLLQLSPHGVVVNMGSALGIAPKAIAPVYCVSKAGLRSFTRALRYQAEEQMPNMRFVDVTLPLVDTDMTAGRGQGKISPAHAAKEILNGIENGRTEIDVGKAFLLKIIMRLIPSLGYRMLRGKMTE